ncbi:MAG: hypothetical protein AB2411_11715, partial [Mesobacillus sp.]
MKHTFNDHKWMWHDFERGDDEKIRELISNDFSCEEWLENIKDREANLLELNTETRGEEYIWGSLIYQQDIEDKSEKNIFHFYIGKE